MDKITLSIDGRRIEVAKGSTILDAARELGIRIPTLCFVKEYDPSASCFLCAVQIEGRPTLSPSCAMPVAEGMVVTTNSDDIVGARKMALELLLSDHAGDCIAPCQSSCPAGLDISAFVNQIARGHGRGTMEVIAETLALPGALGRVCPRLCEERCRRASLDESVSVGALHRFAADQDIATGKPYLPAKSAPSQKSVAMIGAGPAGLAAAYYLLQAGHECTLFDAHPKPGGMLRYGIPDYRLPKDALDAEIDLVRRMGAQFEMERRWGRDFSLAKLRERFDAVFIAIGAQGARNLGCEGEELALSGLNFLERIARGEKPELGDHVVVIGGGNTAMDVSRSALRMDTERVSVLYRRTRNEMPCLLEEVAEAEAEGIEIEYLAAPAALRMSADGRLKLTCVRMRLGEPDESGRCRPVIVPDSEYELDASAVIAAVGQSVDSSLASNEGLEVTGWGVAADGHTLATNLEGVFAGGDAVAGADLAVRAVAAGRMAAVSINQYLRGEPIQGEKIEMNILLRGPDEDELAAIFRRIESRGRTANREASPDSRTSDFTEIMPGLERDAAVEEARRCMSCGCRKVDGCLLRMHSTEYGVDPYRFRGERRRFTQDSSHPDVIYEPGKCILCNACVKVAEESSEDLGLSAIGRGFQVTVNVPFGANLSEGLHDVGRECAAVCPTGAIALRTDRACDTCGVCTYSPGVPIAD